MVSLAGKGREVTVLEGMRAVSSASRAPTTPVAIDASPAFVEAVAQFDRERTGVEQLIVLARPADAATLWLAHHPRNDTGRAHRSGHGP